MTIKVLIADDHQIVRQGLRMLLASEPDMMVVGGP
jgi:DNA-binding NarL/FixJ family response regulator